GEDSGRDRKTASGDGDGGISTSRHVVPLKRIEMGMAAMHELLGGLPTPLSSSRPSNAIAADLGEMEG
ncbi:hypothetical protein HAX54_016309, partial [Datura stramonium]|nr:hypothetical protein [Datura stramonium]